MAKASVCILIAKDTGNLLLLLRPKDDTTIKNKWTFVGGSIEREEDPLETIKREIMEELVFDSTEINFKFLGKIKDDKIDLYYFIGTMDSEETPILNEENVDWGWFDVDNLPKNTYISCREILEKFNVDGFFGQRT